MKWLFLCAAVLFACGGGDANQQPAVAPIRAPQQLAEIVFAIPKPQDEVTEKVCMALEAAMIHAGYRMAQTTDAHDFVLRPQITFAREPSYLQRTVNDREIYDIRVRVVLSILQKDQMIDQGTTEFVTPHDEPFPEQLMTPLTNGIGRSERIRRTAEQLVAARSGSGSGSGSPTAGVGDKDADEKAWIAAKVEACRQPIKLDACDKVRLYIADHDSGAHVDEAKKALEASQPAMEKLQKDENDWQRADVDECKTKKQCTGVELYLKFHPTGLHYKEARALVGR